jgi:hypothetical protein
MTDELERKQLLPLQDTTSAFSWRALGKLRKSSVRTVNIAARMGTSPI